MARPATLRQVRRFAQPPMEGQIPEPAQFWNPPKGLDALTPIARLSPGFCSVAKNLRIRDGWYQAKPGSAKLGSSGTNIHSLAFVSAAGYEWYVRWTITGPSYWDGSDWIAFAGSSSINMNIDSMISVAVWGEKLMFTDGETGIYEINFGTLSYSLLTSAYIPRQIATFAGRVILSYTYETPGGLFATRIRWSVKNDNTDYTGVGSGFDDLLSGPGAVADSQLGVYPISDTDALIVRSGSIWLMTQTGYVDAPFEFRMIYPTIRCDSPWAVTPIPNGLVILGRDDVYLITLGSTEPVPIGAPVRPLVFVNTNAFRRASMAWDSQQQEVVLFVPKLTPNGKSNVWRYSVPDKRWTQDEYQFNLKSLSAISYREGTAINSLTGSIDSLTGPIDELGFAGVTRGLLLTMRGASGFIVKESDANLSESDSAGNSADIPVSITTGQAIVSSTLDTVQVIEIQFEYETSTPGNLYEEIELLDETGAHVLDESGNDILIENTVSVTIEYSTNGGATWLIYSTITLPQTLIPLVAKVTKTVFARRIQFRFSVTSATGFKLRSLTAFIQKGGRIKF